MVIIIRLDCDYKIVYFHPYFESQQYLDTFPLIVSPVCASTCNCVKCNIKEGHTATVYLYDISGRKINESKVLTYTSEFTIWLNGVKEGLYIIQIRVDNTNIFKNKIIRIK